MSSAASAAQTPHSRELSQRTASTDYSVSPEILRFNKLSLSSSDPFISAPLSPEATPFEPTMAQRTFMPPARFDPDNLKRSPTPDDQGFAVILNNIRNCPRPDPPVDLQLRTHNSNTFAQNEHGEPLTCFVYAAGEHHISTYYHGEFAWVRQMKTFVSIQSGRNPNEVFMYFRDLRDADFVVHELRVRGNYQLNPPRVTLNVLCIAAEQYCHASRDNNHTVLPIELGRTFATGFDGQLLIQAQVEPNVQANGSPSSRLGSWIYTKVRQFVHSFSDIKVMQPVPGTANKALIMYHIELFEPMKADEVVDFLGRFPDGWVQEPEFRVWGMHFSERAFWKPVGPRSASPDGPQDTLTGFRRRWWGDDNYKNEADPVMPGSHDPSATIGVIGQNRPLSIERPFHSRANHSYDLSPSAAGGRRENKNTVNVEKIRAGMDVRTTVMLRNIPNRIDQPMLKQIVDQSSEGKYDFMYLRIDFTNNCNVGYAFINFQLPEDIIEFTLAIVGQKWQNSDKVAEVSYATMQGRETLVQKFRNSSVMNEAPASRPKLYYTHDHPLAGQEEQFPPPDNLFKLARSNQNAAHIGLFSPGRGGASYAGFDRHRRGQFDRGTSFADMEELVAENRYLRTVAGIRRSRGGMQALPPYY